MMDIKTYFEKRIKELKASRDGRVPPFLNIYHSGDDPASKAYIKGKMKDCREVGIHPKDIETDFNDLVARIKDSVLLNHHFIVQLPFGDVPNETIYQMIKDMRDYLKDYVDLNKYDADGFAGGKQKCTPKGILNWLEANNFDFKGKTAVVVGRSELVGKPLAEELMKRDMTVIVCHSKTPYEEMQKLSQLADLIIVAVGKPKFFKFDIKNKKPIIVDVGINRIEGKLCGDVDYEYMTNQGVYVTPVPGGVGLLTRLALLENVISLD